MTRKQAQDRGGKLLSLNLYRAVELKKVGLMTVLDFNRKARLPLVNDCRPRRPIHYKQSVKEIKLNKSKEMGGRTDLVDRLLVLSAR